MSFIPADTADRAIPSVVDPQSTVELTRTAKFLIWASLASVLFLNQIAYNIGQFPLALDIPCYGLLTLYLMTSGHVGINVPSLFLFVCVVALACFRIPLSKTETSWSSLLLIVFGYASFSIHLARRPGLKNVQAYILNAYVAAACIIAVVAVVQIVAVNVTRMKELQNIYFVLPESIRGAGTYVFAREAEGGLAKANGYFLRESAELSSVAALAFLIEYFTKRRMSRLLLLTAAQACSLSGSGLIALAAGFLLPKSVGRIPVALATACGVVLLLYLISNLDSPLLNLWFGRLSEFGKPGTSAYARFIAPWEMVQRTLDGGIVTTWLGNGAGSFVRTVRELRAPYEISDPTWAKLTFEYGLGGLVLITVMVVIRLYSSSLRVELCNFMLFSWIVFPSVLKPTSFLIIWLLTLVPAARGSMRNRPQGRPGDHTQRHRPA